MAIPFLITNTGITAYISGSPQVVANDHPNFDKIKDALQAGDEQLSLSLMNLRKAVVDFVSNTSGEFALVGDLLTLDGKAFSLAVTNKVLAMIEAGNSAEPLYNFLRKVRQNPSKTAQEELLLFCEANRFVIFEDGDILAYKSVRGDYTDIHSGKFRNAVGDVVTMERGDVDDNRDRTCSAGLHFAAYEYASSWAGEIDGKHRRLMVMKIHPRDVVSIPSDYKNQKGRCCRYEVFAEVEKKLPHREVYSTTDVLKESTRRLVDNSNEIKRKEAVIARLRAEEDDLTNTISQIENLGGEPHWTQYDRLDQINAKIDDLEDEIEALRR